MVVYIFLIIFPLLSVQFFTHCVEKNTQIKLCIYLHYAYPLFISYTEFYVVHISIKFCRIYLPPPHESLIRPALHYVFLLSA